jgi:hypothetical protein
MRRAALALAALAALTVSSCSEPAGLEVTIDVGDFKDNSMLRVILTVTGGFKPHPREVVENRVTVYSPPGEDSLVIELPRPAKTETFRVTTGNKAALTVTGEARVFDDTQLLANGTNTAPLPIGGDGSLKITVAAYQGPVVSPKMRSTDLLATPADVTVKGTSAQSKSLAVCDFNKDGFDDIAVGVPSAKYLDLTTGGVYVAFGDGTGSAFELGKGTEFHFLSNESDAKLGAAVACADLNKDGFGDLIVGAPGAGKGTGKVYVVYGRLNLAQTTIDLTNASKQPDIQWTTATAGAALGSALFAVSAEGTDPNVILASAPGASLVHMFANVVPTPTPIDADKPDHATFAGVKAGALGAGRFINKTGAYDIVLGDPEFRAATSAYKTGVVYAFAAVPPASTTAYSVAADAASGPALAMVGARDSQFGAAVLALDTTGRGDDLFVGAPGGGANGEGQVFIYEHDDALFVLKDRLYTDNTKVLTGYVASGQFGRALARTGSGTAPSVTWRLLVGAPGARRGDDRPLAGAAYMFGSDVRRDFPILEEVFGGASGDLLGTAVAGGQINDDLTGDLVTLAEGAAGTMPGAGAVYVKYGQ